MGHAAAQSPHFAARVVDLDGLIADGDGIRGADIEAARAERRVLHDNVHAARGVGGGGFLVVGGGEPLLLLGILHQAVGDIAEGIGEGAPIVLDIDQLVEKISFFLFGHGAPSCFAEWKLK